MGYPLTRCPTSAASRANSDLRSREHLTFAPLRDYRLATIWFINNGLSDHEVSDRMVDMACEG